MGPTIHIKLFNSQNHGPKHWITRSFDPSFAKTIQINMKISIGRDYIGSLKVGH